MYLDEVISRYIERKKQDAEHGILYTYIYVLTWRENIYKNLLHYTKHVWNDIHKNVILISLGRNVLLKPETERICAMCLFNFELHENIPF